MRITDKGMLDDSLRHIARAQERLQRSQHRAVSGLAVERPSDNPIAHAQIDAQEAQLVRLSAYNNNIELVRSRLSATEASLQSAQGLLTRFRELTMMALNQVTVTDSVPIEAGQVYEQLVAGVNQTFGGDYLFGGFAGTPPFAGARFVGDNQKRAVEVSPLGATLFGVSAGEAFGVLPGQDVFAEVAAAVQGMRAGNRAQIQAGLATVDRHLGLISQAMAQLGAQQNALHLAGSSNEEYALALQSAITERRDVNPASAYSQLAADRYAMESTFAVLGSSSRLSILKYL